MNEPGYDDLMDALKNPKLKERIEAVAELLFQGENHMRTMALGLKGFMTHFPPESAAWKDAWALGCAIEEAALWFSSYRNAIRPDADARLALN